MIVGIEWIIALVLAVILLLLGPKKIPALARGIGRAIGEFRRAKRESDGEINESDSP